MLTFFKYRFKNSFKNRSLIFWCLLFPIILVTFFHLAFSNIKNDDIFTTFDVGVVAQKQNNNLTTVMKEVRVNDNKLFNIHYYDKEAGTKALHDNKIAGLIIYNNDKDITLLMTQDDVNQMLLQSVLNVYKQRYSLVEQIVEKNPQALSNPDVLNTIMADTNHLTQEQVSARANNSIIVSFYSAIAMTCLYGGFISAFSVETLQGNLQKAGTRLSVSSFKKSKMIILDYFSGVVICLFTLLVLMLYLNYVIKIDFGNQLPAIALISVVGSLFSVAFGYFVGLLTGKRDALKVTIIIAFTMIGSFLAGMMAPQIALAVRNTVPIVSYLNPVNLITNSFYNLYYFDSFVKCLPNLVILIAMTIVCLAISIRKLRGEDYDAL